MALANPDILLEGASDAGVNGTSDEIAFASQRVGLYFKYFNAPLRMAARGLGLWGRAELGHLGLRLRDGQVVLGAGDRPGRGRRRRTPPERDGQRRGPENPQAREPGPAPSECHAKAEYRVCPADSARWAGLTVVHGRLA